MTYDDKLAILEALKAEVNGRPQVLGSWDAAACWSDRAESEESQSTVSAKVELPALEISDEEVRRLFPNTGSYIRKGECQGRKGLPVEFVDRLYKSYCRGHSLQSIGKRIGRSRQTIYEMFKRRGFSLRPNSIARKQAAVTYKGVEYSPSKGGYLRATFGDRHFLQRIVWEEFHGSIPPGFNVIFKDGNKRNFSIENLCLESVAEQLARVRTGANQYTKRPSQH